MESEDIIATHPDTQNFEEDNKNALILNGTLLSETQTGVNAALGATNLTSSKTSFGSVDLNKKSSEVRFQDSRTPFSKRLEMLSQGISSKSSVMIPESRSCEGSHDYAESTHDIIRLKENKGKVQENRTITNQPDISHLQIDVSQNNAETETTSVSEKNSESASDDEKNNLIEIFDLKIEIDEEYLPEAETNSNKRTRLSSPEDASISNQSFLPVAPVPTILNQTSEEEKPNVKSKSSGRPVRKTRGKRKIDK